MLTATPSVPHTRFLVRGEVTPSYRRTGNPSRRMRSVSRHIAILDQPAIPRPSATWESRSPNTAWRGLPPVATTRQMPGAPRDRPGAARFFIGLGAQSEGRPASSAGHTVVIAVPTCRPRPDTRPSYRGCTSDPRRSAMAARSVIMCRVTTRKPDHCSIAISMLAGSATTRAREVVRRCRARRCDRHGRPANSVASTGPRSCALMVGLSCTCHTTRWRL